MNRLSLLAVMSFWISTSIFFTFLEVNSEDLRVNLLDNPGFELGLDSWYTDNGAIRSKDPLPHSGLYYLMGGVNNTRLSLTSQRVNLLNKGFTAEELDSGLYFVNFGGWQSGWHEQTDSGMIQILFEDSQGSVILQEELEWFYSNNTWKLKQGSIELPISTRFIVFTFHSKRYESNNNDGYLDDAFLEITDINQEDPILTGFWKGNLTATQSNCLYEEDNGNYSGSVNLIIEYQDGKRFSGDYTVYFGDVNSGIREDGKIEGIISSDGSIEATISFQDYFGNELDTNGKGIADGSLINDNLSLFYYFSDFIDPSTGIGDTCTGNGQINVTKSGEIENGPDPATDATDSGGGGGCFIQSLF